MSAPREFILASSSDESLICSWDLHTGSKLSSYHSSATPINSLCHVGKDLFAASQTVKGQGVVSFWAWSEAKLINKSFCGEAIGCIASSGDGSLLVGGSKSGKVYLWEAGSGRLLHFWNAHYKSVTCLSFSSDDSLVISGGDDALVNVWAVIRLVARGNKEGADDTPLFCWADHQQPVTGLHVGSSFNNAVVVSSSSDRSCKVWSLALGTLLRSIVFPAAIRAVVVDPGENALYAGSADGRIYITVLNHYGGSSAAPGSVAGELDGVASDDVLLGHRKAITALAFNISGSHLISGSEDGSLRIWDTFSRQCLHALPCSRASITSILLGTLQAPNRKEWQVSGEKRCNLESFVNMSERLGNPNGWVSPNLQLPKEAKEGALPTDELNVSPFRNQENLQLLSVLQENASIRAKWHKALKLAEGWRMAHDANTKLGAGLDQ